MTTRCAFIRKMNATTMKASSAKLLPSAFTMRGVGKIWLLSYFVWFLTVEYLASNCCQCYDHEKSTSIACG